MNTHVIVNVARDYSTHPMGREDHLWPFSGERFRREFLEPSLLADRYITVDLRGTRGLAPSFLEEAFGGLIDAGIPLSQIKKLLKVVADDDLRVTKIWHYIDQASEARAVGR